MRYKFIYSVTTKFWNFVADEFFEGIFRNCFVLFEKVVEKKVVIIWSKVHKADFRSPPLLRQSWHTVGRCRGNELTNAGL